MLLSLCRQASSCSSQHHADQKHTRHVPHSIIQTKSIHIMLLTAPDMAHHDEVHQAATFTYLLYIAVLTYCVFTVQQKIDRYCMLHCCVKANLCDSAQYCKSVDTICAAQHAVTPRTAVWQCFEHLLCVMSLTHLDRYCTAKQSSYPSVLSVKCKQTCVVASIHNPLRAKQLLYLKGWQPILCSIRCCRLCCIASWHL